MEKKGCDIYSVTVVVHCAHCRKYIPFSKLSLDSGYSIVSEGSGCVVTWSKVCPKCQRDIEFKMDYK